MLISLYQAKPRGQSTAEEQVRVAAVPTSDGRLSPEPADLAAAHFRHFRIAESRDHVGVVGVVIVGRHFRLLLADWSADQDQLQHLEHTSITEIGQWKGIFLVSRSFDPIRSLSEDR